MDMHDKNKSRGISRRDLLDLSVSHIKLNVLERNFKAGMETGKVLLRFIAEPTDVNEALLLEHVARKGGA